VVTDPATSTTSATGTTGTVRRVQPRGVQRRRAILDAALEEFSVKGSRGTIASIAESAGITDAGLLYHFPTKDDLLLEVVKYHDELGSGVLGATEPDDDVDPLDGIRSLASWGDWMDDRPNLQVMHTQVSAQHLNDGTRGNDYFRERYRGMLAVVTRLFERARDAGAVHADVDPTHEAQVFIALLDGLRLQMFFGDTRVGPIVHAYVTDLVARIAESH
jgi:AcrR family transcriptional regulator